jgi:4-hydroxy-tetrahydrodipicolinate synthase
LKPLFEIVTVKTNEQTDQGTIPFKARNPLPIKTLMRALGLPVGPLRPPMGKMTKQAIDVLLNHARKIQKEHPEIFEPLAEFFDIDVQERLMTERHWQGLHYDGY